MKKIFKIFSLVSIFALIFITMGNSIYASNKNVILSGDTIGLRLDTGVRIAGKYQVRTDEGKISPWKNSDLNVGDLITKIDNTIINNNSDLLNFLAKTSDNNLSLTIVRGNKTLETNINLVTTINGDKTLGLYIKDRLMGIGTMTFIDPTTRAFASLGHGIYDENVIMGNVNGNLLVSNIEGIKKATPGSSGEKRAALSTKTLGKLKINTTTGLYGILNNNYNIGNKVIEVASQKDVKTGPAKILTVIDGTKVEEFTIEIIEVSIQNSKNVKGLKIKVTDQKLIDITGGIIQGMSGSPIVQNGKLVGAVSHVMVDNPTVGYGMHIEWMLEEVQNLVA